MFEAACLLSLYAETPVHAGTGSTFGAIDLPIQRERHTNLPVLPASSLKGVLRDVASRRNKNDPRIDEVFGPEVGRGNLHAGAISPTDARLLLFPLRSTKGIFVWATCPFILERLRRDAALTVPGAIPLQTTVSVRSGRALMAPAPTPPKLVIEDDAYEVNGSADVEELARGVGKLLPGDEAYAFFKDRLKTHLVVLADDDLMRLTTTQTDVVTRNRLNEQKTTTGGEGNMWVQEYTPSDSLFYSLVLAMSSRREGQQKGGKAILKDAAALASVTHLQIGGDETVGRGWMRAMWIGVPA